MPTESGAHRLSDLLNNPQHRTSREEVPRIHPERPATVWVTEEEAQQRAADAMMAALTSGVSHLPDGFLRLLRTGHPDAPETVAIGGHPVTITASRPGEGIDPGAELACWMQLVNAVNDVAARAEDPTTPRVGDRYPANLPEQIATATWVRADGRTIRAIGPRHHRRGIRRHMGRLRRGHTAHSIVTVGIIAACNRLGGAAGWSTQAAAAVVGAAVVLAPAPTTTPQAPSVPDATVVIGTGQVVTPPKTTARRAHTGVSASAKHPRPAAARARLQPAEPAPKSATKQAAKPTPEAPAVPPTRPETTEQPTTGTAADTTTTDPASNLLTQVGQTTQKAGL